MLPPKTSHHAKFHRDRSNQLGDRDWSEKKFPHTDTQTDTRHPDWLSRASQHARGATKKAVIERLRCDRVKLLSRSVLVHANYELGFE